ncbi:MAG: hypothetical protein KAX37_10815 [Opitutaceae bacterium]|nr:hypothetical protein [Opitutaceae bacterium]
MPPRKRRLKRSAIISALTRLDELCEASRNRIEVASKRWLIENLLEEVSSGKAP